MRRFTLLALSVAAVACGNSVIVQSGSGGAGTTSNAGTGGIDLVSTVGSGSSTVGVVSVTTAVSSSSSGGGGCLEAPDCPDCFCNEQPAGCEIYQQELINNIYCGMSCGVPCADFCNELQDISPACDACLNGGLTQADVDTFIMACEASPDCLQFAASIQQCNQ